MIISNKFTQNSFLFSITFALIPLWWVSGFGIFIFHIISILILINRQNLSKFSIFEPSLFICFCVVTVTAISASFFGAQMGRVASALFNASNLIVIISYSILSYSVMNSKNKSDNTTFVFWPLAIMGLIAIIGYSLYKVTSIQSISMPTLIAAIPINSFELINEYKQISIYKTSWFANEYGFRIYVYAPFATASAIVCSFLSAVYFLSKEPSEKSRFSIAKDVSVVIIVLTCAALTLTRTQMFAMPIVFLVGIFLSRFKINVFLLAVILLFPLILYFGYAAFEFLLSAREGSNSARFGSYAFAVDIVMSNSPIFGIGVKPNIEESFVPVGSHSSFFSYLVRGGAVTAIIATFAFLGVCGYRSLKIILQSQRAPFNSKSAVIGAAHFISLLAYFPFGEVDAYPIVAMLIGTFSGLLRYHANRNS